MTTDPLQLLEDRLAEQGCAPRRRGDKITARCPAHEDRTPSLDVTYGTQQPLVIVCRAGCDTERILNTLHLTWADISTPREPVEHHVTASYPYYDEHGTLLYTVERIEPGFDGHTKSFRQKPANGKTGPGAMRNVRRVPYRLPNVAEAVENGLPVWICEGEKDAETLIAQGVCATTNAGGAEAWDPAWNTWLGGGNVVIVVDRDRAGYQRGARIANSLEGIAHKVVIVEPAEGKDATDHVTAGHGLRDFTKITVAHCLSNAQQHADTNEPDPDQPRLAQYLINWDEIWTTDSHSDWLIEPFIARGRAHTMYAPAKTAKSLFSLYATASAALQQPTFGLQFNATTPVRTLYVDQEMTPDDLTERLADMGWEGHQFPGLHYMQLASLKPLDTAEGGLELVTFALHLGVDLVVIDTTSRVIAGEENSADTFRWLYMHTIQPLKAAGIATLRLDHTGKDPERGQRGSSAKNDDVDVVYRLTRTDTGVNLTATHRRMGWIPESTAFTMQDDPLAYTLGHEHVPAGTAEAIRLLEQLGIPRTASQRQACATIRAAGHRARTATIAAALKARRRHSDDHQHGDDLI